MAGKSTLISALLLTSSEGEVTYSIRDDGYRLEGVLYSNVAGYPPTVRELLAAPELQEKHKVVLLEPSEKDTASAAAEHRERERKLREYNIPDAHRKIDCLNAYLLPCGRRDDTSTSLTTSLRYGSHIHLHVSYFTLEELQGRAFAFVKLLRSDDYDATTNDAKLAYAVYLMITTGNEATIFDLSLANDINAGLPATADAVVVCAELEALAKREHCIYLPPGRSLRVDQLLVKQKLDALMLDRGPTSHAVRGVTVHLPSTMLKGGNALMDLPGLNSSSPLEQMQIKDAVSSASTGAVLVVLSRTLAADEIAMNTLVELGIVDRVLDGRVDVHFVFNGAHLLARVRRRDSQAARARLALLPPCAHRDRLRPAGAHAHSPRAQARSSRTICCRPRSTSPRSTRCATSSPPARLTRIGSSCKRTTWAASDLSAPTRSSGSCARRGW